MDPFGDDASVENGVPTVISDFVPFANKSGEFYEVEPTEDTANETHEDNFQHMEERYEPMDFDAHRPVVEEENELTKFMYEYEKQIALKAQEQEKVAVECKVKAEESMAQFEAERQRIKESKMQFNRESEQAAMEKMEGDLQNENPWARVVTLVDLEMSRKKKLEALNSKKDSEKQDFQPVAVPAKKTPEDEEDVSRMRQLFVQLKTTPLEQTRANAVAAN